MKQRAGLNTPFPFEFVGEGHLVGGTERGVRTLGILVMDPAGKVRASMADCKDSVSLSSLSRMRPLKFSTNPFCVGLPGAMECHSMPTQPDQAPRSASVRSRSTLESGAWRSDQLTHNPPALDRRIDHCRQAFARSSSTTLSTRNRRPWRADRERSRTSNAGRAETFLAIKPLGPVLVDHDLVTPLQDVRPSIAKPPAPLRQLTQPRDGRHA